MMGLIQSIYYPDYIGIGKTGPEVHNVIPNISGSVATGFETLLTAA